MHILKDPIDEATVQDLISLSEQVEFSGPWHRVGANGPDRMSVYQQSRWYSWTKSQRDVFAAAFSSEDMDWAAVGWFLKFPPQTGFLDVMDFWVDKPYAGTIVAVSLSDNNDGYVAGEEIILQPGEKIEFSLKNLHEVRESENERLWACIMQLK
jgi:hypothetical protein